MYGTNSTDPSVPNSPCQSTITSTCSFIFNLIILVFIPLSYVPQYHRIFMHKSTYGLSPYFLLFSTLVSTSFLGSGVFQAAYTYSNRCCREDPGVERGIHCYGIQMGAWQALIQWVCCTGLFVLFYVYARAEERVSAAGPVAETAAATPALLSSPQTSWRVAKRISYTGFIYILITLSLFLAKLLHKPSDDLSGFVPDDILFYIFLAWCAGLQMLLGIILLCVQSVPQITTTLRMKRLGSLSIPTMCMQVPGYFMWAALMQGRYYSFIWFPMLVAGTVQATLLVLSLYLELKRQRHERAARLMNHEADEDWKDGEGEQAEDVPDGYTTASSRPGPISL